LATETEDYSFLIGDNKEKVVESLFKFGDVKLIDDIIQFYRVQPTFSPFGLIGHHYFYRFSKGKVVQIDHVAGGWVGPKKKYLTQEILDKGNSTNLAHFNSCIKKYDATKIQEKGNTIEYVFDKDNYKGRIIYDYKPLVGGLISLWEKEVKPTHDRIVNDRFWFGIGNYNNGVEQRIKETNSIPYMDGQVYIWTVTTDFIQDTPVQIKIVFPSRPNEIPKGTEFNYKENSMIVPVGVYKEKVILKFEVNEGDPKGVYNIFLIAKGETFAGISYTIK